MSKSYKSKNHKKYSIKIESKYEYVPDKNLILVKVSYVNEAMGDFKSEIYDEQDDKECHFVRILRVGPETKDVVATAPGALVIVQKAAGKFLERLSGKFGEEYYLLCEDDILAYVDM